MYYMTTMQASFEAEKNRKAFLYTVIICAVILLLAFFITWPILPPTQAIAQDLIEINLGNDDEGFGEVQPLIKGEMSLTTKDPDEQQAAAAKNDAADNVQPDDNAEDDAAAIIKPNKPVSKPTVTPTIKQPVKTTAPVTAVTPTPKPKNPIATYKGPGSGKGNGATEDNGYKYQGNNPNGTGDKGSPTGNPDSYGNTPGGKVGGPRVTSGNRKIVHYYTFSGDLEKATIYAKINVSPEGKGTFVQIVKPSSSTNAAYATAIKQYLQKMEFDKAASESTVTVQFNFTVQ
ncbi:hypothetical protein LK994_14520 [Ferruginibacter lapsinanis]|uniref:hypothetical protein n=1 Tax=Ferruginibacter lapsinanis TaxID=563172 RepID=UPI001E3ABD5F|nr:hypothetical protein [Ferruginibacter lapsinanis]UEG49852.1 hypothetical protein LK994_14520 [Ferruginibacter lapsinanis]